MRNPAGANPPVVNRACGGCLGEGQEIRKVPELGGGGGFQRDPQGGKVGVSTRNRYHLSFWRFFPCFIALFGPVWGQSMQRAQLWCCDVFPCFKGISGGFSDSVKRHLRGRHLSVLNLNSILFPMVGAPAKNKLHSH